MCAIYGFYKKKSPVSGNDKSVLSMMGEKLRHRGPDDQGFYYSTNVALGSNLLSIVDIKHGHQPMIKEVNNSRYVIVYNGEIYNYDHIKTKVETVGLSTQTYCDTEIVLLAYIAFGDACVEMFNGQFAFSIWDERKERLFLGRDIVGIKPLFYVETPEAFVFASEPKALFEYPGIKRAPNYTSICEYFLHGYAFASGYVTGSKSFFEDVSALQPAHTLTLSSQGTSISRYWDIPVANDTRSLNDFAEEIRHILGSAIKNYVSNEVPVGTALSGGIDSSAITALAAQAMTSYGKGIVSRSIRYDGQIENTDFDSASLMSDYLRDKGLSLSFGESLLSPETYLNDLDKMIYHFDEPHWEVKQLAMFNNYKALKQAGAKVVLTGEGADELFFGYYQKFPGFKNPEFSSADNFRQVWSRRVQKVQNLFTSEFNGAQSSTFLALMNNSISDYFTPYFENLNDHKKSMQCWYYHTFLHWLLTVNDRCSAAFSLEGRFPFLDRDVIELAFRIQPDLNIDETTEKKILREAFRNMLPAQILSRAKSPLPSPIDLRFHRKIYEAFEANILSANENIWNILSKAAIENLKIRFKNSIEKLESQGLVQTGGKQLTEYLYLNQEVEIRSVHVFSMLTLLRWFAINFGGGI